ncbi:MAG: hypothetical protein BIFFINMI_02386 [Phycisphaerae bacterium]|nr:hypothetical protein [Phycisphaerae bacterium]
MIKVIETKDDKLAPIFKCDKCGKVLLNGYTNHFTIIDRDVYVLCGDCGRDFTNLYPLTELVLMLRNNLSTKASQEDQPISCFVSDLIH